MSENKPDHLFYLASRAHFNKATQIFKPLGLHRSWPSVLVELEQQDGQVQVELAKKLEVTPATLTNLLNRMEQAGLIRRVRDLADTRISKVFVTELGNTKLSQAKEIFEKMDEITFAGFSQNEKVAIKRFLERIHQNLIQEKFDSSL
jgi:MarR family transcriptional regulator, organic hydroperoxide resistance regulator